MTLPFKTVYIISGVLFVVLEILAIWTTRTIIGMGGQEVYPLAINFVDNEWFLWGSKFLALSFIAIPLHFLHKMLGKPTSY